MSSRILSIAAITGLAVASTLAHADDWRHDGGRYRDPWPDIDYARVVDVQPLVERVRYRAPVQECFDVERGPDRTGSTLAGGLLGAVIGHQFGSGGGRRAATVAGAVIGGAVANDAAARAEARDDDYGYDRGRGRVSYETQCRVRDEARYEERVRAYRVIYRFHGREYTTELPYDPGPRLRVAVDARPL